METKVQEGLSIMLVSLYFTDCQCGNDVLACKHNSEVIYSCEKCNGDFVIDEGGVRSKVLNYKAHFARWLEQDND
jgi:hypothetical protein